MSVSRCPYEQCYLPENNNRFLVQLIYLIVSLCVLIQAPEQFNFFSLFLYLVPILMDLICSPVTGKILRSVRRLFIGCDAVLLTFVLLGMLQIIEDTGPDFCVVGSALVFSGLTVSKRSLCWVLMFNLMIPVMYWVGSPSKRRKEQMQEMKEAVRR